MGINLLATLLLGLSSTAVATETLPIDPNAAEVLRIEKERHDRFTVPVTIAGQGPYRFMIDTGAQATVLSRTLADALKLYQRRPAILIGMASRVPIETVGLENLKLGSRSFYIQSAPIVEPQFLGEADGILGLDSLQQQRVLLDFANQRILVADAEDTGGNRGFDIVVKARTRLGQLIITSARVAGIETALIVDTGAQGSVGNLALLRKLRKLRHLGDNHMTDVNGAMASGAVKLVDELMIGSARMRDIPVLFLESPTFEALKLADKPALILGMQELQLFRRVAIDFPTRKVLFDLPAGALIDRSSRVSRFGAS